MQALLKVPEIYNIRITGLHLVTATILSPLKLIIIKSVVCGTGHIYNIHYSQVPSKHIVEHRQDMTTAVENYI